MRPLDDELRAVLTSRADSLPLVPDPIVGIEQRARRMRRNRVTAAVAGTALAVSAIAVAVPALTTSSDESLPQYAPEPTPSASVQPSPEPTAVALSPYALDPANPWPYRGVPQAELGTGTLETVEREYSTRYYGAPGAADLTPLYGMVGESSQEAVLVFLAVDAETGEARWGAASGGHSGPEFVAEGVVTTETTALPVLLPGDEVASLLVVASPDAGEVQYAADGATEWVSTGSPAPGVGLVPLEGDPETDRFRVLAPDGTVLHEEAAPDPVGGPDDDGNTGDADVPAPPPTNVVDWPTRGLVDDELYRQALAAYARETGVEQYQVDGKVLYAGSREGRTIMLLQAWGPDEDARNFGYLEAAGNETTWLGQHTAPGPAVIGFLVPAGAAFLPNDLLVVVPEPAAGQVLYSADGSSEPQPVPDQGTEVAVLVERAPGASADRLLVLDGDGDPERPILRGSVADLLATF